MQAILCPQIGPANILVSEQVPVPEIKDHEILVKVHYSGINFIDIYFRSGVYPAPHFPFIPGKEGSGEVISVGSASSNKFKPGDRVVFPFGGSGTYCEYVALSENEAAEIPDELEYETAAAVILQGLTAHYLSVSTYSVQPGDLVLVHSGAGGVGLLLTQMCKNAGARVITTVSTEEKKQKSLNAGADEVIIYRNYRFQEEFLKFTGGEKAAVVYDSVAKETFEQSLLCIRPRGILALFGNSSGVVPPFQLNRLNGLGSLYVTRPSLNAYIADEAEFSWRTEQLFSQIIAGKLNVDIGKTYSLNEAAQAHQDLEDRKTTGKSILQIL